MKRVLLTGATASSAGWRFRCSSSAGTRERPRAAPLGNPGRPRLPRKHPHLGRGEAHRGQRGRAEGYPAEGRARYERAYRAFVEALLALEAKGVGPDVVAETVFRATTAPTPRRRYPVRPKSRLLPVLFAGLPAAVADALRLRLFGAASS